jgi:hypothetical protein
MLYGGLELITRKYHYLLSPLPPAFVIHTVNPPPPFSPLFLLKFHPNQYQKSYLSIYLSTKHRVIITPSSHYTITAANNLDKDTLPFHPTAPTLKKRVLLCKALSNTYHYSFLSSHDSSSSFHFRFLFYYILFLFLSKYAHP